MEESIFLSYLKTKPLHEYYHAFTHMKQHHHEFYRTLKTYEDIYETINNTSSVENHQKTINILLMIVPSKDLISTFQEHYSLESGQRVRMDFFSLTSGS